jgi:hypothetical protein
MTWFDTRPHYYSHTYDTQEQCQAVKQALENDLLFPEVNKKGAVCTDHNELYLTHKERDNVLFTNYKQEGITAQS